MISGSYIEYQERFSATEGHNLYQNSWENLQIRNHETTIDSISFSNRQANREN